MVRQELVSKQQPRHNIELQQEAETDESADKKEVDKGPKFKKERLSKNHNSWLRDEELREYEKEHGSQPRAECTGYKCGVMFLQNPSAHEEGGWSRSLYCGQCRKSKNEWFQERQPKRNTKKRQKESNVTTGGDKYQKVTVHTKQGNIEGNIDGISN